MKYTIVEENDLKFVGFRVFSKEGNYAVDIPKTVVTLAKRIDEIQNKKNGSVQCGLFVPDLEDEEADEKSGYYVAVEVEKVESVPEGMVSLSIPKQNYAVSSYTGPVENLMDVYENYNEQLLNDGLVRIPKSWHIEKYGEESTFFEEIKRTHTINGSQPIEVKLCVPV